MSLINQMLKDLEKRRADSVASPDSALRGVNRYSVARRRPPYLLYALVTLLLVLAGVAGFFGWVYLTSSSPAQVETPTETPRNEQVVNAAPLPVVPTAPEQQTSRPAADTPASQPGRTENNIPAETAASQPASQPASVEPTAVKNTVREQPAPPSAEPAASKPDDTVTKQSRPLSDEQQAELAYKKGYQLLTREQSEAGERQLRAALTYYPQHHRARELLAGVYIKSGRYVEAAALLKEGVTLAPEQGRLIKLYARVLHKQNKLTEAITVMEREPPLPGVDSEYYALLAAIYQQAGRHLNAAATYRDVLRVNPEHGSSWIGLGISLEQLGKYTEARSAYTRASNSPGLAKNLRQYAAQRLDALAGMGNVSP